MHGVRGKRHEMRGSGRGTIDEENEVCMILIGRHVTEAEQSTI